MYNEDKKNKDLENRLKQVLNTDECNTEECKLKDPQELVYRENKK